MAGFAPPALQFHLLSIPIPRPVQPSLPPLPSHSINNSFSPISGLFYSAFRPIFIPFPATSQSIPMFLPHFNSPAHLPLLPHPSQSTPHPPFPPSHSLAPSPRTFNQPLFSAFSFYFPSNS